MLSVLLAAFIFFPAAFAARGGKITRVPITYTSGLQESQMGGEAKFPIARASYQYTGFGAAESSIDIEDDGTLIYSPALNNKQVGYATSNDTGKTWTMVVPSQTQARTQPMFNIHDGRYFYWSSGTPGLRISYSDDKGKSWKLLSKNLFSSIFDWAKMLSGKPVKSKLQDGSQILYASAPSTLSVTAASFLRPISQKIWKSVDRGLTWQPTKGSPTLSALETGGPCEAFTVNKTNSEYIIWSNGLVRPNGTIMFGVRRCRSASVAISDDEGDTWRWSDVPGSSLVSYEAGLATWVANGNVLTAEPISQDTNGNLYFIWVDDQYVLKLAMSPDDGNSWSSPIVVSAPGNGTRPLMSYHPIITQHPNIQGRAALAYYGSKDGGATWNGYVAESGNLNEEFPVFSSTVVNEADQPLQANLDKTWDQGYQNPFWDLIEFIGLKYHPISGDIVSAFARKMCSRPMLDAKSFDTKSCVDGWDFYEHGNSTWQGYVSFVHH